MEPIVHISPFKNGYWVWDDSISGVVFISREPVPEGNLSAVPTKKTHAPKATTDAPSSDINFRDTVDVLDQIRFRRHYQRKCKPEELEVITLQDVKDVALFTADVNHINADFIKFFHIPTVDRFLKALIVYFQYYLEVWNKLMVRRESEKYKLTNQDTDNLVRDDLADLRSMVSREYGSLLVGSKDAHKFHHMANKNNDSLSGRDKALMETLIKLSVRVVWLCLQRRNLNLIELELNRLLRSTTFNIIEHKIYRSGGKISQTPTEKSLLSGTSDIDERKLLQRSPLIKELLLSPHNTQMLGVGFVEFEKQSARVEYMEKVYTLSEDQFVKNGILVGILGLQRMDFDPMLMPCERKGRKSIDHRQPPKPKLTFNLPPKLPGGDDLPEKYPHKQYPYKVSMTESTAKQCKIWCNVVEKNDPSKESIRTDISPTAGSNINI